MPWFSTAGTLQIFAGFNNFINLRLFFGNALGKR
jgi:hypothetical protein